MNKENPKQPEQKTELFKVKKNYCWLTGYPVDKSGRNQKPVMQTIKVNF